MKKNRIFIVIEGGLIQSIFCDRPNKIDIVICDYDTEGEEPDRLIENLDGDPAILYGEDALTFLDNMAWDMEQVFEGQEHL